MPDKAAPLDVLRKYAGFTQIYDGIGTPSLRDSGKPAYMRLSASLNSPSSAVLKSTPNFMNNLRLAPTNLRS
jgi:hypothetical protein